MGNLVGIDLGTTNTVAGFKWAEVEVVTALDNTPPERKLTPSVVCLFQDQLMVGEMAYHQLKADPENVVISIKRLMGRGFGDPIVQQQLSQLKYKITQSKEGTENSLSVILGGKEYTPEQISSQILKKVIKNAQKYQEFRGQTGKINQAVVTIPAYFNDKQRYATQMAARQAGLIDCELLAEPTAAAISYGFKPDSEDVKTILVYDFGGGTFDSSVITASGNDFIESGKAGDLWLGGDDLDNCLMEFVKKQIEIQEDLTNIDELIEKMPYYQKIRFLGDLKIAVEKGKIELSQSQKVEIIPSTPLLDELGMAVYSAVTIHRQQFESLISPLVDRSIAICQQALRESEFDLDLIDVVLLVGGSSQIPLVQRKVKEVFGEDKVVIHPRPMYAVAEGAAIVAAGLTNKETTVSRDYFIELVNQQRFPIVKKGEMLPVIKSHTFKTQAQGQRLIHFKFFSPDQVSEVLDNIHRDERIGEMWLALDRSYAQGTEILVTVELDEKNNSLQITAVLKHNPAMKVSCSFSRGGVDEEISRQVEFLIDQLNEDGNLTDKGVEEAYNLAGEVVNAANQIQGNNGKIQEDRLKVAREKLQSLEKFACEDYDLGEFLMSEFEFSLHFCGDLISETHRERLTDLMGQLRESIALRNLSTLQKLIEDGRRERENLCDEIKMLLLCRDGIRRAHHLNPAKGKVMASQFAQMLRAMEMGNVLEADRLMQELLPDVREFLEQDLPTGNVVTGLSR
jgi:molecular chaperone DnaK